MGLFSKYIKTLDDLFVHQLRDIYYAEKQIVQALPEMIEKATDAGLKRGFETHLAETKNHVKRVEQYSRCTASRQRDRLPGDRRDHRGSRRDYRRRRGQEGA